jgi:hypothetical protein
VIKSEADEQPAAQHRNRPAGHRGAIREDIREIRSDIKLLTGKVYELMAQKS